MFRDEISSSARQGKSSRTSGDGFYGRDPLQHLTALRLFSVDCLDGAQLPRIQKEAAQFDSVDLAAVSQELEGLAKACLNGSLNRDTLKKLVEDSQVLLHALVVWYHRFSEAGLGDSASQPVRRALDSLVRPGADLELIEHDIAPILRHPGIAAEVVERHPELFKREFGPVLQSLCDSVRQVDTLPRLWEEVRATKPPQAA
jgi:hypothetical protein